MPQSVVATPSSQLSVYLPPIVPLPQQESTESYNRSGRSQWVPEGAPANAGSMQGMPPLTAAPTVHRPRILHRPLDPRLPVHGIPRRREGDDVPTVAFTSTTDRLTDAFCACSAAVEWLLAIPHLISVTVGQPALSLAPIADTSGVRDPRVGRRRPHSDVDLELPHFLRQPSQSPLQSRRRDDLKLHLNLQETQTERQTADASTQFEPEGHSIETQATMGTRVVGVVLLPGISPAECANLCQQRGVPLSQLVDCLEAGHRCRLGRHFNPVSGMIFDAFQFCGEGIARSR